MGEKILFVNSEIYPYLPENHISGIGRYLPQGIQERKKEIRSFMPRYGCINERKNQLHEVIRLSGMNIVIDDVDRPLVIKVASISSARMQVYFIDNDDYFDKRGMECDEAGNEYEDNDERAIFYARGVLETVKKLRWRPDVIHCQGWISAVAPLYIKTAFKDEPSFDGTKVVFEINDVKLKNNLPENFISCLATRNVTKTFLKKENLKFENADDLLKLGIKFSDALILGTNEPNKEVVDYAESEGKPVLPFVENPDYASYYGDFYEKLLS